MQLVAARYRLRQLSGEARLTKKTSSGWPDPSDWSKRLFESLEEIGDDYMQLSWEVPDDPEAFAGANLKQARAAEAVLALANALRELPPFQKSKGVAVLHDIAGAFNDVVNGGSPRLFASTRAGKQGGDGTDRNYLKMRVVIAVRALVEGQGWPQKRAVQAVTAAFADAGAKGRKGGPLAASTVQGWCERIHPLASNPEEKRLHKHVQRNLDDLQAHESWPGTEADALAWVSRIASNPLVASKYG